MPRNRDRIGSSMTRILIVMYSTCIFCRSRLGHNDLVEGWPAGRRLAFDAMKGRLWVICPRCARWNLAPLEERWEAVEACESHFGTARARYSTDNIGLAQDSRGLDLVRIGSPTRREFAAWRYGRVLRRRRAQMSALVATSAVVAAGVGFGGVWLGAFDMDVAFAGAYAFSAGMAAIHTFRRLARIDAGAGNVVDIRANDLPKLRLREVDGTPVLDIRQRAKVTTIRGPRALAAVRSILPWLNRSGGSSPEVDEAVEILEYKGDQAWPRLDASREQPAEGFALTGLGASHRLAVEMAANEEIERRALEGELAALEREWRDAEEVARIADDLLVPAWISERLASRLS
jgi:hypothetical protein